MNKTEFAESLEKAISLNDKDIPGKWTVHSGDDYVQLVWECDAHDVPEMYGDEPWSEFGGNGIIKAVNAPEPNDSGCDSYIDRYNNDVVSQWVQWNFETDD